MVTMMHSARLNETKNWLREHPGPVKYTYRTTVKAIVAPYISAVDPIRIHCQKEESEFSQFSRHVSVQE